MCGYPVSSGYRGLVNGEWMLFPTEAEYHEYMEEESLNLTPIRCSASAYSVSAWLPLGMRLVSIPA